MHCIASHSHAWVDICTKAGALHGSKAKQSEGSFSIMGDRLEERKDFTAEVTAKLPEAKKLAEVCAVVVRC